MIEGIFIGTQIKQIFKDLNFSTKLNSRERKPGRRSETSSEFFWTVEDRKIS
jgi:hypothetical protein